MALVVLWRLFKVLRKPRIGQSISLLPFATKPFFDGARRFFRNRSMTIQRRFAVKFKIMKSSEVLGCSHTFNDDPFKLFKVLLLVKSKKKLLDRVNHNYFFSL